MTPLRRSPAPALVGAVTAGIGAVLGASLVVRPALVVPATLEATVLVAVSYGVLSAVDDPDERRWLRNLLAASLAARVLVALIVHFGPIPAAFFAPDALGYESAGRQFASYVGGEGSRPAFLERGWRAGYWYLNGVAAFLLGEARFALVTLNLFAGVWTTAISHHVAHLLLGRGAARSAAVFTGFFPSLVLWSVLNIRDSLATLMVMALVWAGVILARSVSLRGLALFAASAAGLAALRDYMSFLVPAGLLVGSLAALRPRRLVSNLALGTIATTVLAFVGARQEFFQSFNPETVLTTAEQLRSNLQSGATSSFGNQIDTTSPAAALLYLPVGAAYVLFAPFPWAIETTLQATAAPETLLWYPIFALSMYGVWRAAREGNLDRAAMPLSVLLVVVASYALVEGNFGTAYRHRAQVMPLFFIFAGVGWQAVRSSGSRRVARTPPPPPPARPSPRGAAGRR